MDPRHGAGADPPRVRCRLTRGERGAAAAHARVVAAAAAVPRLPAEPRGGAAVEGRAVPGHPRPGQPRRAPRSTSPTRPGCARTTTPAPPGRRSDRPPWWPATGARFVGQHDLRGHAPRARCGSCCHDGTVNATVFIDFCRRLLRDAAGPVYLVLDGHPVHRSGPPRSSPPPPRAAEAVLPARLLAGAQPR